MDLHIDDFFKHTALVLLRLYASFPRKITLYVEDIVGAEEPDEFGMHSDRYLACFAAMLWLAEEQHIRYEAVVRQEAVDQAVLTGPTFTLLTVPAQLPDNEAINNAPETIRLERNTNIQRLREALKSQSSTRLRLVMSDLLNLSYRNPQRNQKT